MKVFMTFNRYLLLGFWLAFAFNILIPFDAPWGPRLVNFGLLMLLVHVVEYAFVYKKLSSIGRATAIDFCWVALLGFFHWKPLFRK